MTYIIAVGIAVVVLFMLLYMALQEDDSENDGARETPVDKAPKQAKPKLKPPAQPKTTPQPAPAKTAQQTNKDDLTQIEGVGPKIAGLLTDAGIHTFKQLASLEVDALKRIVTDGGVLFREKVAMTWSAQAQLAANEKWDALTKLQAKLKGGAP